MTKWILMLAFSAAAFAADVTGKWSMNVETDMGSGTPTFVFKQDGENLTGTYSGQLGEAKVTGTVKGDAIQFQFEVSPGGDKILAKYSGKLEGSTKMKGEIDFSGMAKGKFTGEKQ